MVTIHKNSNVYNARTENKALFLNQNCSVGGIPDKKSKIHRNSKECSARTENRASF